MSLGLPLLFALALGPTVEDPFTDLAELERAAQAIELPEPDALEPTWRERILPRADELRWTEIPWIDSFAAGVRAADGERKPVLFWAMNGHPLGCT